MGRAPVSILDLLRLGERIGAPAETLAETPGAIRAFHGSPARFNQFNDAKIADPMTAGWGHYFTEHEPLAARWQKGEHAPVYVYETDLHLKPEQIVDYWGPLSGQPHAAAAWERVLASLSPAQRKAMLYGSDVMDDVSHSTALARLEGALAGGWSTKASQREAARRLKSEGIAATRFWDPRIPDDKSDFAVIDPSVIEILRRYRTMGVAGGGILGALAAAHGSAEQRT